MSDEKMLVVSAAPHLRSSKTVGSAMRDVFIALVPVALVSIYFFQWYSVFIIGVCLLTAVLTEVLFRRMMNKAVTLHDWSALLTGLFMALLFPATTPWWKVAIATFIGVGVAKELMGGLGKNRFNPALFGRISLIILAPIIAVIDQQFAPLYLNLGRIDVITQATPLAMLHQGMEMPSLLNLFFAFPGGALAETSPFFLLIGAAYLFYRGHINWRIPVSVIGTVFILTFLLGENPIHHLLVGSVFLGAFFMATDWVTSPFTDSGKLFFGTAIGVLIVVFRVGLAPTEGVAFAILIMNGFVPLIEKYTARAQFGRSRKMTLVTQGDK